jgi:predicted nucleotidyltransferase
MAAKGKSHQAIYSRDVERKIRKIKQIFSEHDLDYARMILFGSQARGQARPDSDIDICLVVGDHVSDINDIRLQSNKWVALAGIAADIIVTTAKLYRDDLVSPMLHEVRSDGIDVTSDSPNKIKKPRGGRASSGPSRG